jgi:hypothetical protein
VALNERREEPSFIAMEFIEGIALDEKMRAERLGVTKLLDIATQIADALDAARGARNCPS